MKAWTIARKACALVVLIASIGLTFVAIEACLVLSKYVFRGTLVKLNQYDDLLGWRPTGDFKRTYTARDASGRSYSVDIRSYANGSRLWGTHPGAPKVLFIGDSFTQAEEVSNDKTYYYHFSRMTGFDTYAIGCVGYGTLQEMLLLKEVTRRDGLVPDMVVLQFCNNDFINNTLKIEKDFIVFQQRTRPYLVNDAVVYDLKKDRLFMFLLNNSYLFRFLLAKIELILLKILKGYSFRTMDAEAEASSLAEAVSITGNILDRMRGLSPGTKYYAFNCDEETGRKYLGNCFNEVMTKSGFIPLSGAVDYVKGGPTGERGIMAADGGHFNEEGHLRLAKFLAGKICGSSARGR